MARRVAGRPAISQEPRPSPSHRRQLGPVVERQRPVSPPSPPPRVVPFGRRRDDARHRLFPVLSSLSLFLLDCLALVLAFGLAYRLRDLSGFLGPVMPPPGNVYLLLTGFAAATIVTVFSLSGMYRPSRSVSRFDELFRICTHISFGLVVAIAGASLVLGDGLIYSRQMLAYGWGFAIVAVTSGRILHASVVGRLRARGVAADRLLIVGTGSTGQLVLDKVRRSPRLGYEVVGFARFDPPGARLPHGPDTVDGVPVLGATHDLATIVEEHLIDEIIVALSGTPHEEILELVYAVTDSPVAIRLYPDTFRLLTSDRLNITDLNGLPTVTVRTIGLRPVDRAIKRCMDIVISAMVLVLLSPLLLTLALLVKLTSRGPVFFIQERVGQDGRAFHVLKFRTMVVNAEQDSGPVFAAADDPRRTRVGAFLRRYSLDELPQFINVLLGEMSIVGPRPERPFFVEQFSQLIPAYMARHHEKAGITGWAQVNGLRGQTSIEERTRYDLYYVENWSILFDLKIMLRTLVHIFRRDNNAY
ncbi:MAG: undecaprenyl-phosphate glucose phosphotransferase [Chloroflexi bacterium]|nr:MAG: undecaprenyl-phosphate glucose phosphotransferase [Chloroflexota bacterium]